MGQSGTRVNRYFDSGLFGIFQPDKVVLYELTHDFDGPIVTIVTYLQTHAKEDDTVAVTYCDVPIKFLTGLKVFGGLTGEDNGPAASADWFIIRRNVICEKDYKVRDFLIRHVDWKNYDNVVLDSSDTPFEKRESPEAHLFRTDASIPQVVIFQKKIFCQRAEQDFLVPYF